MTSGNERPIRKGMKRHAWGLCFGDGDVDGDEDGDQG